MRRAARARGSPPEITPWARGASTALDCPLGDPTTCPPGEDIVSPWEVIARNRE